MRRGEMIRVSVSVAVIAMFFCSSNVIFGQADTGRITGTVTDSSGATVPAATVVVENEGTALKRELTTTDAGHYTAPLLPPGNYRVTVQKQGFKAAGQSNYQARRRPGGPSRFYPRGRSGQRNG